ncbi:cell division protein FtsK [Chromobacterium haemolyticum]|uniref:cell division protein FtsK n=1 Tax=Chromobacterium haemolyticum TaxID=394935 RepID=UPI000DEFE8D3|nr:cell division protein FtsK [Chromobacterium haemolyticum]
MQENKDVRAMTSDTIGKDLLSAMVQEMKLLPDVWVKLNQQRQDDVIERLRKRIDHNVRMAVHILASEGRTVVVGELDQVVRKDGIKAVFKINSAAAGRHDLFDSEGKACLIVVADAGENLAGMDEVVGEPDQRAMDLGHEYHENDGGGMGDIFGGNVVDAEFVADAPQLPAPGDETPTEEQLDKAFDDGYDAALAGGEQAEPNADDGTEPDAPATTTGQAVRYQHPDDPRMTWRGRGRKLHGFKPGWTLAARWSSWTPIAATTPTPRRPRNHRITPGRPRRPLRITT